MTSVNRLCIQSHATHIGTLRASPLNRGSTYTCSFIHGLSELECDAVLEAVAGKFRVVLEADESDVGK